MYKQSATRLQGLPKEQIQAFIKSFDTVLTDCDGETTTFPKIISLFHTITNCNFSGVIWLFNEALQGAPNVINRFLEMGKKVFFVTNNSTKTRDEFLAKAKSLNFNMTRDGIISTAYLAAQYLKHRQFTKTAYVVGSQGIIQELEAVGIKTIGYGVSFIFSHSQSSLIFSQNFQN